MGANGSAVGPSSTVVARLSVCAEGATCRIQGHGVQIGEVRIWIIILVVAFVSCGVAQVLKNWWRF